MVLASLVVLPTVLMRDMSALSYVSVGGITSSVALAALVAWEGAAVTGFQHASMPLIRWDGVPLALGLYSFCYSGGQRALWGGQRAAACHDALRPSGCDEEHSSLVQLLLDPASFCQLLLAPTSF